jgi:HSP20 family molecular chaperone IbpA
VVSTIQSSFHPLHTNLADGSSRPLHIIGQLINDPWYTFDELRHRRHGGRERSGSSSSEPVFVPEFDVHESENYYFLEGEFPGVKDKEDIHIEWVGHRNLVIDARIPKVDEEAEWGILLGPPARREKEEEYEADVEIGESADRRHRERDQGHHGEKRRHRDALREFLSERNIGQYSRSFSFPHEVDPDGLKARLSHGLLKIIVPKVRPEERETTRRIQIED